MGAPSTDYITAVPPDIETIPKRRYGVADLNVVGQEIEMAAIASLDGRCLRERVVPSLQRFQAGLPGFAIDIEDENARNASGGNADIRGGPFLPPRFDFAAVRGRILDPVDCTGVLSGPLT